MQRLCPHDPTRDIPSPGESVLPAAVRGFPSCAHIESEIGLFALRNRGEKLLQQHVFTPVALTTAKREIGGKV